MAKNREHAANPVRRGAGILADLSITTKGLVVVAIPVLAVLALTASLYLLQKRNEEAQFWVERSLEIGTQIQTVHTAVEEAETSVTGFLLTGRPEWLEPFKTAKNDLPALLNELESMVSHNPAQLDIVRRLRGVNEILLAKLEEAQLPGAAGKAMMAETRPVLEEIRNDLKLMRAEQEQLLAEKSKQAVSARQRTFRMIGIGAILAPLGGILAMLLFTAGVARRIKLLEENARRLSSGRTLLPATGGKDEIGSLEECMADASNVLAAREAELRATRDELEVRVEERTAELARANLALQSEVAERARAESDLRQAHDTFRAVIHASPLAIISVDLRGVVRSWSRAAEQIFGWRDQEVIGRMLPTIPEDEREEYLSRLSQRTEHGSVLAGSALRRRRKDGSLVDVRVWTSLLRDGGGAITGELSVVADFTDPKRLEEQLLQAQRMEAVGRLAGGVAHDFNNLLTVISGYGHMVVDSLPADDVLRGYAEEVLSAAERAAALTNQLLAFSRRQGIQPKLTDLNELVSNMNRMLTRVIGEDIELKTVLRPDIGKVVVDPGRIEQVIMNLVVNARDAMPKGGKLIIETSQLDPAYAPGASHQPFLKGPHVMLAISDTGVGMDAETKQHLFEPFFTTKEKGKGTGLGLSTVYGIVQQHGGHIWVYSEAGKGTTVKIYLPRTGVLTVPEEPALERMKSQQGSETILLVEDEEGVRKLIREILESRGYTVLEAAGGKQALELARRHHGAIELLLTDVVMPGMNGSEVAEALRLARPETKVLFLSGYTDSVVLHHGVLPELSDFLEKPFTPEILGRKVRMVLDGVEERQRSSPNT